MKRMFLVVVPIILMVSSPCYSKDKWDDVDKLLLISVITLNTVDCLQTNYIFDHDEYYETNSIINDGVNGIGKPFVPLYFATASILHYLISDYLSPKYRKLYLSFWCVSQYSFVSNNYELGIGFSF